MKKLLVIVFVMAVFSAIIISRHGRNASREVVAQSNTPVVAEPSSTVQTNLHFDGLHANPNVQ